MRKMLLILSTVAFATSSYAADPQLEIHGGFDAQAGYLKNSGPVASKHFITGNNKSWGFNTSAHILLDAHNTTDAGIEYGAKIALATTTRNARSASSSLYLISQAGKWEFGSDKSAVAKMKITPYTNACATKGAWDTWVKPDPSDSGTHYVANFGNFLDAKVRHSDQIEYPRKVTYYTPEFAGFQIGVSYIPDTTNDGYASFSDAQRHEPTKTKSSGYELDIKKGFAGGITYENQISEDLKIKLALVGEIGKVIPHANEKDPKPTKLNAKFNNLKAYTVGTQVDYKDFSFGAGYSDYMKSLSSPDLDDWHNRNTNMYGFNLRYNHPSKVSTSLTYFTSKNKGNKLGATTLAMEYKIMPGIMPYAEVTLYQTKGKYLDKTGAVKDDKNHGTAVVLGTKFEF